MKKVIKFIIAVVIILVIAVIFLWRVPIYVHMKSVELPENSKDIKTIIQISDVHELHIEGMRIVRCEDGYEEVKAYTDENNSENSLKGITVLPFFAEYEFNPDAILQVTNEEKYKYVLIKYYKKI